MVRDGFGGVMRVVHVVTQLGTYGGERLVAALAAAQRSAGIDASIVTIYDSPAATPPQGVTVYSAGRHGTGARGGGISFFFRLTSHIRRLRPDIVHTHLAHGKHWGRLAALAAGARCIVHTEHGNDFSTSLLRRALTRLLHRQTAGIVALTHAHAERISAFERVPAGRIAVVPNGIALEAIGTCSRERARRALGAPAGARVILFLGRLDSVKQPLRALAACGLLPAELNAHVYFAGEGPLRDEIAIAANAEGIATRVHLLGYRTDAGILLHAADAVLNTSQSEAMPLSLIEALCAGVPIVSTPWPGAREVLCDAAVSDDFQPASIARSLETALRRAHQGSDDLSLLRTRFSIERTAATYARLYEKLAGSYATARG
ncbi:MAG TPA: glycosyltransferase [Candidatus Dormibacteraeota bacterium]|nr:glycosyltransferase [Candidatus Dormibacteraeota bacterium]